MFTARVTSKFAPPANQTCISGIFSNAVFMGHISWPIGGHLQVYKQSHLQVYPLPGIKNVSLQSFQMQCSWVTSHGQ